ncbi:SAM-dependent methyltransferase [Nocardia nova]|uniref:SAM-dependent methyltransferase n=1 Tax=Nocardia nova TaxID=37330 RepID=UPI0033F1FC90
MSDGPTDIHTEAPHPARMYDYFLGGKDNYEADRLAGEQSLTAFPTVRLAARANRDFMARTTRSIAQEQGLRQFLDIGTGIPTEPNLHQIAQAVAPESRVVYVDNDPVVLVHARALLTGTAEGRTAYVKADATDPAAILAAQPLRDTLDLTQPVAVSLIAVLHFITGDIADIVGALMDPLAPGSTLTVSHVTTDLDDGPTDPDGIGRLVEVYNKHGIPATARTREQVQGLFKGFDLVDPGVELIHRWRPEGIESPQSHDKMIALVGGVGVKQ